MEALKILVVDDDVEDYLFFATAIKKYQAAVDLHYVRDGNEVINYLRINPIDIIFLDLYMPVVDGITCLKELRSNDALKHIPVIIFSGSKDEALILQAFESGASCYIVKTPSEKGLETTLRSLLSENWRERLRQVINDKMVINET
jgi:PleD family two-component response regulator